MSIGAVKHFTLAVEIPNGYQLFHIKNTTKERAQILAQSVMTQWLENNNLGYVNAFFGESAPKP